MEHEVGQEGVNLLASEGFALEELLRHPVQGGAVAGEEVLGLLVGVRQETPDLPIHGRRQLLRVPVAPHDLLAEEHVDPVGSEVDRAQ